MASTDRLATWRSTSLHYDGPIVFDAVDKDGCEYIGTAVEVEAAEEAYAILQVTPERLQDFKESRIDLLDLMVNRDIQDWFLSFRRSSTNDFVMTLQTTPITETDYLPDPGFFLNLTENGVSDGS